MTNIQLTNYPSLFQTGSLGRSARYKNITTASLLESLFNNGFVSTHISVSNGIKTAPEFRSHCVTLEHASLRGLARDGSYPVIYLRNSFDGSSAFRLSLGVYRLVCSNGLKAFDAMYSRAVRHVGDAKILANDATGQLVNSATQLMNQVSAMQQTQLNVAQHLQFIRLSAKMILPDDAMPTASTYEALSLIRRSEDSGADLWSVFNVVQENAMTGKIPYITPTETGEIKNNSTRAIRSISRDFSFNRELWRLATQQLGVINESN